MRLITVLGLLALFGLTSCGSGSDTSSAKTTAPAKSSTTAADSSSTSAPSGPSATEPSKSKSTAGGWPGANGCDKPSAADIGTAFGDPITGSIPGAQQGCIWKTATPGHGVQVSYHTADNGNPMPAEQLEFLHSTGTVTDLTVPGASQAFIHTINVANLENPVAYVVYPEGTVQIAMSGAAGTIPQSNQEAVVKVFTGG